MARMEEQHKEHVEEILGGDSVRKSPKPECATLEKLGQMVLE